MVAEQAKLDYVPSWDSSPATLERFEEDVLIFVHSTEESKRGTCGPKLLQKFREGSAERALGLSLLRDGTLQKAEGCQALLTLIRQTLGKEVEQDVSEHYQRYLHRGAHRYGQSMQSYIAEEAQLHDRALKAVASVETDTKTLLADSLRGFLLLELSSLTGSEQVNIYTTSEKRTADENMDVGVGKTIKIATNVEKRTVDVQADSLSKRTKIFGR